MQHYHSGLTSEILADPLVTPSDTAKALHTKTGTLQVWRSTGRYDLEYVKIGGKVLYKRSSILKFIDDRSISHTGENV